MLLCEWGGVQTRRLKAGYGTHLEGNGNEQKKYRTTVMKTIAWYQAQIVIGAATVTE